MNTRKHARHSAALAGWGLPQVIAQVGSDGHKYWWDSVTGPIEHVREGEIAVVDSDGTLLPFRLTGVTDNHDGTATARHYESPDCMAGNRRHTGPIEYKGPGPLICDSCAAGIQYGYVKPPQ